MLPSVRWRRARTAAASSTLTPRSRSTASSTAWVVLPVMIVEGGRLAKWTRWTAFCMDIAATPANPVSSPAGASLVENGPSSTASAKNASSRITFAASRMRSAGRPCVCRAAPARRASATTTMNSGSASSLAITPCVPKTRAAPSVTKLPVTCAVNNPSRPRKPAVSTNPPLKLSNAATTGFLVTILPPERSWRGGPAVDEDRGGYEAADDRGMLEKGHHLMHTVRPIDCPERVGQERRQRRETGEQASAQPAEPPAEKQRRAAELRGDHQRREEHGWSEAEGGDLSQRRVEVEELGQPADDKGRG